MEPTILLLKVGAAFAIPVSYYSAEIRSEYHALTLKKS
jgi:hypothetical protein